MDLWHTYLAFIFIMKIYQNITFRYSIVRFVSHSILQSVKSLSAKVDKFQNSKLICVCHINVFQENKEDF